MLRRALGEPTNSLAASGAPFSHSRLFGTPPSPQLAGRAFMRLFKRAFASVMAIAASPLPLAKPTHPALAAHLRPCVSAV